MKTIITYKDVQALADEGKRVVLVDVRTQREFNEATIPGAINIPVLLDEQHAEIGTLYKENKIAEAKSKGVKYVSLRLSDIYDSLCWLTEEYDVVVLFCSRGGYRSSVLFATMRALSVNIFKLEGGYKYYRKHVISELENVVNSVEFVVLNGGTGSGKTEILNELETMGENVLDLESAANHRGSLLGGIGLGKTRSQKMFESIVYDTLYPMRGQRVYCEGESKRIGTVIMPNYIKDRMNEGIQVLVTTPMDKRIQVIKKEYVDNNSNQELIEGMKRLNRYISKERLSLCIDMINAGEYEDVIELLIDKYYDIKYKTKTDCEYEIINKDSQIAADNLVGIFKRA